MSSMEGDKEFTPEEDRVLYQMISEPERFATLVGDQKEALNWTLIAEQLKKTVKSVEARFMELKNAAEGDDLDVDIDIGSPDNCCPPQAVSGNAGNGKRAPLPVDPPPPGTTPTQAVRQAIDSQPPIQASSAPNLASREDVGATTETAKAASQVMANLGKTKPKASRKTKKKGNGLGASNDMVGAGPKTGAYWSDEETIRLLRLVRDEEYRESVTGSLALDWANVGACLGRGARAAKRKFDNLADVEIAPIPGGDEYALILPVNEGKKWKEEELIELLQLGDPMNASFRQEKIGVPHIDWWRIARYFGRSRNSVTYKFSYEENAIQNNDESNAGVGGVGSADRLDGRTGVDGAGEAGGNGGVDSAGGPGGLHGPPRSSNDKKGHGKHNPMGISYKSMAIAAFFQVDPVNLEATSTQICEYIEGNVEYAQHLDRSSMPGKKNSPRWKHGIRSSLYKYPYFIKTGRNASNEIIWRLDVEGMEEETRRLEEKSRNALVNKMAKEEKARVVMAKTMVAEYERSMAVRAAVENKRQRIANRLLQQEDDQNEMRGQKGRSEQGNGRAQIRGADRQNGGTGYAIPSLMNPTPVEINTAMPPADVASEPKRISSPITLQQILEQSMTADQLAQLTPEQLLDLQNQLNASLAEAGIPPHETAPPSITAPNVGLMEMGANTHNFPPAHAVHPMQTYMSYYGGMGHHPSDQGGMMLQGNYDVSFQQQEGVPMGMYVQKGPHQRYEGPPDEFGSIRPPPPEQDE